MVTHQSKTLLLENGDRLSRVEFERRYQAMPELKKAELIEGRVYIASPVRIIHGQPHAYIMTCLGVYCAATPGTQFADNTTVRLDTDNEPQPDALLRIEGGQSQIDINDYIQGAPELIVEIAASTASYDLQEKLQVYRRNGVREYLVWQVSDKPNGQGECPLREGRITPTQVRQFISPVVWRYRSTYHGYRSAYIPLGTTGDASRKAKLCQSPLGTMAHMRRSRASLRIFDWFLREGEYIKLQPDEKNIIKSELFPGLWLAIDSLLNYDLAEVIETVQQGLATKEHQDFVMEISN